MFYKVKTKKQKYLHELASITGVKFLNVL
jgi:hypothetical protein